MSPQVPCAGSPRMSAAPDIGLALVGWSGLRLPIKWFPTLCAHTLKKPPHCLLINKASFLQEATRRQPLSVIAPRISASTSIDAPGPKFALHYIAHTSALVSGIGGESLQGKTLHLCLIQHGPGQGQAHRAGKTCCSISSMRFMARSSAAPKTSLLTSCLHPGSVRQGWGGQVIRDHAVGSLTIPGWPFCRHPRC